MKLEDLRTGMVLKKKDTDSILGVIVEDMDNGACILYWHGGWDRVASVINEDMYHKNYGQLTVWADEPKYRGFSVVEVCKMKEPSGLKHLGKCIITIDGKDIELSQESYESLKKQLA